MKKFLLLVTYIGGLTISMQAKALNYGPKVGPTLSFIFIDGNLRDLLLQKSSEKTNLFDIVRITLHWGAYVEYALKRQFSTGLELVYTRAGGIFHKKNKISLHLSYINIPFWGSYYPFGRQQGLSFYFGSSINFLWRATPKSLSPVIEEKYINPIEWAIIGGCRYLLDFGLSVDLRYNGGLMDILDYHPDPGNLRPAFLKNVKLTNQYLQLSVSYNLALLIQGSP